MSNFLRTRFSMESCCPKRIWRVSLRMKTMPIRMRLSSGREGSLRRRGNKVSVCERFNLLGLLNQELQEEISHLKNETEEEEQVGHTFHHCIWRDHSPTFFLSEFSTNSTSWNLGDSEGRASLCKRQFWWEDTLCSESSSWSYRVRCRECLSLVWLYKVCTPLSLHSFCSSIELMRV